MEPVVRSCPRCGGPLGRDLAEGMCSACLLEANFPTTTLVSEADPAPGFAHDTPLVQHFGPYELLEEIGRGGMGVIYKARQPGLDRLVALKMLLAGEFADAKARERLLREARIASRLSHPGIVTIHDVGEHQGRPYFAMEYVPGRNLAQHCRDGLLPIDTAVRYVEQLARAVHYAHQHGVIHRDLKPANVLISLDDQPKLTDFGLTKSLVDQTKTLESAGSPNFMAPEQADPQLGTTGTPTDIFGLGAILYHLLTGRPPAVGESLNETLRVAAACEPAAPRQLRPALPRDLETITLKCLERDQGRRYGSALEVAEELARWRNHEPIHARPASSSERLGKWVRRRPLVAGLGTAVFLSLVVGILSTAHQWRQAVLARNAQRHQAYAADLKAVQIALMQSNRGLAIDLLERHRPGPGDEDLRTIEWRYLWRMTRGEEARSLVHPDKVKSATFSPNGQWVGTACVDGQIRVWDAESGKVLQQFPGHPTLGFRALTFSADGRWLAGPSAKGLQLRRTGDWLLEREFAKPVLSTALSADGRYLAATSSDEAVRWDLQEGSSRSLAGIFGDFANLAISGDGSLVVLALRSTLTTGSALVWEVDRGTEHRLGEFEPMVAAVALSPDTRLLAIAGFQGDVECWDWRRRIRVTRFQAHPANCYGLAFSSDGQLFATGGSDQIIRLWDTTTWKQVRSLQGHRGEVWALEFLPGTRRLVSSSMDGTSKIWNLDESASRERQIRLDPDRNPVGILPDGRTLVASSRDRSKVETWDLASGRRLHQDVAGELPTSRSIVRTIHPEAASLLETDRDGTIRLFDLTNPGPPTVFQLGVTNLQAQFLSRDRQWLGGRAGTRNLACDLHQPGRIVPLSDSDRALAISPDSRWVAQSENNWTLAVWDLHAGRRHPGLEGTANALAMSFAFSPDGQSLACGGWDGQIRIWNLATGKLQGPPLTGHLTSVLHLAYSPDGRTLLSASPDRTVRFWDLATGRETLHFADTQTPNTFYSSPPRQSGWDLAGNLLVLQEVPSRIIRITPLNDDPGSH